MVGFDAPSILLVVAVVGVVLLAVAFALHVYGSFKRRTKIKQPDSMTGQKLQNELISVASHQLRTPLSVIDWYSESLLSGNVGTLSEQQRKYMGEIYQANQRTLKLVNMLLNASRLESGTFAVVPEPTNLVRLTEEVLSGISSQIKNKKLVVTKEFAEDVPTVRIDKNFMQIVLENIILNAVHYTQSGGSIWISLKHVFSGTKIEEHMVGVDSVLISVQDTGIGIPIDEQSQVFSKLFRAANAKEHRASGTGLGLYIAKSILEQTDGQVWFSSEENVGTTFYVTVPVIGVHTENPITKADSD